MLSTDKQTDRQTNQRYQKHNLLCQGGNEACCIYGGIAPLIIHAAHFPLLYNCLFEEPVI